MTDNMLIECYNLEISRDGGSVGWSSDESAGGSESSDSGIGAGSESVVVAWTAHSGVKELGRSHSDDGKNDNDLEIESPRLVHVSMLNGDDTIRKRRLVDF
jgi:hypothetical protein